MDRDDRARSAPSWLELLATGAKYLGTTPAAWAYVIAIVVGAVLIGALYEPADPGLLPRFGLLAVETYGVLLIARHAMIGRWEARRYDLGAFCRLVGVFLLLTVVAVIVVILLELLFGFWDNLGPTTQAVVAVVLVGFIARIGFYLPALALGEYASFAISASQSRPYWRRLLPLFAVTVGVPEVALAAAQSESGWGSWPVVLMMVALRPIGDVIGWVAVSRLYIWSSRPAATIVAPS